jgi:hypothetical protein
LHRLDHGHHASLDSFKKALPRVYNAAEIIGQVIDLSLCQAWSPGRPVIRRHYAAPGVTSRVETPMTSHHDRIAGSPTQGANALPARRTVRLAPQIHHRNLLALVAHLTANGQPCLMVQRLLCGGQLPAERATGRGRCPAGQLLVALLGIGVAQAM